MAHFAKLGIENIVERVNVVSNDVATTEQAGIDFLKNLYGQDTNWKQTSYNTYGGVHSLGGTPLRKNFAGIGHTYDENRDAFIAPKTFNSWILDEDTCVWKAPIEKPITYSQNILDDNNNPIKDIYNWNEETQSWDLEDFINNSTV